MYQNFITNFLIPTPFPIHIILYKIKSLSSLLYNKIVSLCFNFNFYPYTISFKYFRFNFYVFSFFFLCNIKVCSFFHHTSYYCKPFSLFYLITTLKNIYFISLSTFSLLNHLISHTFVEYI